MKKVVIIGSKPNASIPLGDIIYCTNKSISLYFEKASKFNKIVIVSTSSELNYLIKNRNNENPYAAFNSRTWDIITSYPDKIVITGEKDTEQIYAALNADGYQGKIEILTKSERRLIIGDISGCYDPIITSDFYTLPIKRKLQYINSIIRTSTKRTLRLKANSNCMLRPSTGILSVAYAIQEHGCTAEYVIAGIGLKKRGIYSEGKNEDINKQNPFSHIFADKKVLQELSKRYTLTTTEQELVPIVHKFTNWHKNE